MIFTYSKLLVTIQFSIIIILLIINESLFNNTLSFIISGIGLLFGIYALFSNGLGNFNVIPDIKENSNLIKHGAYKYIRHPMYFSVLLTMFGIVIININSTNLILYLSLILVLYLKAKKEESLWSEKTEEYKKYQDETKMFIPFIL